MTSPGDPGEELREHWGALADLAVPVRVLNAAKSTARRSRQRRRSGPGLGMLAAAAVVTVIAVGLQLRASAPPPSSAPSASLPQPSSAVASAPHPSNALLRSGVVAEVWKSFALVPDRPVEVGQKVFVVDGPVDHEGEPSYLLQHWGDLEHGLRPDSDFGWLPAAEAEAALRPVSVECPAADYLPLTEVASLQLFERPICFGDRELQFNQVTASDLQYGGRTSSRWLSVDGRPDFFTGLPFYVHDVALQIPDGTWVDVRGHFNDPSSADCGDAAAVAWCRQRFFVTEIIGAEPPAFVLRGEWRSMAEAPIDGRTGHAMVWTGSEVVIWGGQESNETVTVFDGFMPAYGAAWDPAGDRWRRIPEAPIDGRSYPVAAWSGQEILVWGGSGKRDGAAYDPVSDRWRLLPEAPLDPGDPVGGWVDGRLVVVTPTQAAAYEPRRDTWDLLAPAPVHPGWRSAAIAADRLVLLAYGDGSTDRPEAAILDVAAATWTETSVPLAPLDAGVEAFGAGHLVVIPARGRSLDPETGTWGTFERCDNLLGLTWTGRYLIGPYGAWEWSPQADHCLDVPPSPPRGAPFADTNGREAAVGVWTGEEYVTWSGGTGGDIVWVPNDGAAFRPEP